MISFPLKPVICAVCVYFTEHKNGNHVIGTLCKTSKINTNGTKEIMENRTKEQMKGFKEKEITESRTE